MNPYNFSKTEKVKYFMFNRMVDCIVLPLALIVGPFTPIGKWDDGWNYAMHRRGPYFETISLFDGGAYLTATVMGFYETISLPLYFSGRGLRIVRTTHQGVSE